MWSDPDEVENWAVSPRGAGWLFGGSVTQEVRPLVLPCYCDALYFGPHYLSSLTTLMPFL